MSPRKPRVKEPGDQKKSPKGLVADSSAVTRALVLFEQMQGRFDVVLDAVVLNRRALEEKIDRLEARVTSDIAVLTSAVQRHTEQMERKAERAELALLDYRVKVLEQRVGISPA